MDRFGESPVPHTSVIICLVLVCRKQKYPQPMTSKFQFSEPWPDWIHVWELIDDLMTKRNHRKPKMLQSLPPKKICSIHTY
jgi:hypothetical protein